MASAKKQLKMVGFINHRMRIDMKDGRQILGQMLGFDRHLNMVIADAEELRKFKRKNKDNWVEVDDKRALGLIIIRGQEIVAAVVDGPPPADPSARLGNEKPNGSIPTAAAVPGITRPAGRGIGLQGPAAGVGGPGFPPFGAQPGFGGPPGFGRGGFPAGPPGFPPQPGMFPPGGRGFPPQGGFPGR